MILVYNLFKSLLDKKPIDFRDIIKAVDICIKEYRHREFEFLYNKFIAKCWNNSSNKNKDNKDNKDTNNKNNKNNRLNLHFLVTARMMKNKFAMKLLLAAYH